MSTLVVLAIVAALVGALGFLLTSGSGRTRGRHGGGSAVVPRAVITAVPLLASVIILWAFRGHAELGMAAIALWWACLPWLALTGRLSAWGHAGWALGANAGAAGLVYLAWLITSSGLSVPVALGAWALWAVVTAAVVLFLGFTREAAAVDRTTSAAAGRAAARESRTTPRPAMAASWLAGGAAAVALSLVVQPSPPGTPAAASQWPAEDSAPTAPTGSPTTAPTESAPAEPPATATGTGTPVTPRPESTTSVARSGQRATTPPPTETTATKRRGSSTTTATASPTTSSLITLTISPSRKKPKPTPTGTDDD